MNRAAFALWAAGLLLACGALGFSQEADDPAFSGMSRQLRMGIRYYEKGEDLQAMDRFMDVLTKGEPAERSMANEYINLITHRMNTGEKGPPAERPTSLRPTETIVEPSVENSARDGAPPRSARSAEVVVEPSDGQVAAIARPVTAAPALPPPRVESDAVMPSANKSLMKREIKAKLRASLDQGLSELREIDGIRLLMMSNGDPQAVAIPAPLLFQAGIAFQRDAAKILDALTKTVFSLGGAQVVILPEGTAIGDAKVLDMRRTMGISSHLFSAGVAPARVRVNLLNTQVDIPKPLLDFRGIVVLFVYNQPLGLVVESSLGEEAGPPLSLGIFPPTIRPDRGEGAVIEFSVQDPPAGLVSWRFQLLEPSDGGASDLAALQEVVGGSPVFHQVFWNGRRNYFGPPLAPGRYEAVLTASDSKNRQRSLHRWIQVVDPFAGSSPKKSPLPAASAAPASSGQTYYSAAAPKPPAPASGAPSADLLDEISPDSLIKGSSRGKQINKRRQPAGRKTQRRKAKPAPRASQASAEEASQEPTPQREPAATSDGPKPSKPAVEGYQLDFNKNTHQLTPEAEKRLAQVVDTLVYYPMENVKIQGFAQSGEANAAGLAERRAKMVAGLLINKYQIDPKKIQVASAVLETAAYKVQVSFVKDQ